MSAEHLKRRPRWPITIATDQGRVDGELRSVTNSGIFIHCDKPLNDNETYRMVIRPTPKLSIEVKGKLILSNPGSIDSNSNLSGMALSFVRVSEKDHKRLKRLILAMEVDRMENVKNIKMKLEIETDKRNIVKDFRNLHNLRVFLKDFFSLPEVADRRTGQSLLRYTGRERRMSI